MHFSIINCLLNIAIVLTVKMYLERLFSLHYIPLKFLALDLAQNNCTRWNKFVQPYLPCFIFLVT